MVKKKPVDAARARGESGAATGAAACRGERLRASAFPPKEKELRVEGAVTDSFIALNFLGS